MNRASAAPVTASQWSNWNGAVRCEPARFAKAESEAELQAAVKQAVGEGITLRVAGGGHSFGPLVATDGMILDPQLLGTIRIDGNRAAVPAGRRLRDIFDPLWDRGLALRNMGELDTTTLTGAIATGVHGTGLELPSVSASLVAARLVTASGEVITAEAGTDLMRAARVSMGMLGVMSEVTIELVPAYDLVETSYYGTVEQALEEWDTLLHENRHFNVYYLPNAQAVATYPDIFPPVPKGMTGEICFTQLRNARPPGKPSWNAARMTRRDRMNRILTFTYPETYREIEFAIPLEDAKIVFAQLRDRLRTRHPNYAQPIDIRFVAQDDALLSWCHDGPKAIFSVPEVMNCIYENVLEDLEELFYRHGGLPHWGKEHRLTAERLTARNPNVETFRQIRRTLDPDGLFLNDHLRPLFA